MLAKKRQEFSLIPNHIKEDFFRIHKFFSNTFVNVSSHKTHSNHKSKQFFRFKFSNNSFFPQINSRKVIGIYALIPLKLWIVCIWVFLTDCLPVWKVTRRPAQWHKVWRRHVVRKRQNYKMLSMIKYEKVRLFFPYF